MKKIVFMTTNVYRVRPVSLLTKMNSQLLSLVVVS